MQPLGPPPPSCQCTSRALSDSPATCFLQPLPAPCTVCCTARLLSVDGRKLWSSVELADRPGGTVYATGKVSTMQCGASCVAGHKPCTSPAYCSCCTAAALL